MTAYLQVEEHRDESWERKSCEQQLCAEPAKAIMVIGFSESEVFLTTSLCDSHADLMRRDLTPPYTGPRHLYLMWRPATNDYQFGKTNDLHRRITVKRSLSVAGVG